MAERHDSAGAGRQCLQRREGAGRRSAGRGTDRKYGRNTEDKGGALCCCWRNVQEAAELETAAHEKENGNKKSLAH